MELILLALGFFLGGLLAELFLLHCTKTRMKWLRFLPLAAVAWLWGLAWTQSQDHSMFAGLSGLAALAHAIAGGLVLLGWCAARGIDHLNQKRRNNLKG